MRFGGLLFNNKRSGGNEGAGKPATGGATTGPASSGGKPPRHEQFIIAPPRGDRTAKTRAGSRRICQGKLPFQAGNHFGNSLRRGLRYVNQKDTSPEANVRLREVSNTQLGHGLVEQIRPLGEAFLPGPGTKIVLRVERQL